VIQAFTGEVKDPEAKVSPDPTVISSMAPVDAVVLPKSLAVVIVRAEEPTAPDPAAERAVLAPAAVVAAVPPWATERAVVRPVREVMSPLAPDTAALSAVLAPEAVVEAVPPLATARVPVTPVVKGKPVRFVATPDVGVPRAGVTRVGLFDSTTLVVPVEVVTPVPPLATARVPARVTTPVVAVEGVNPVVPAENDATTDGAVLVQLVPLDVSKLPAVPGDTELNPVPPPFPTIAALAVVDDAPVPPWATESGVVRPVSEVMSPLAPRTAALSAALAAAAVVPAVPPEAIGSAAPRVSEGM
jgi:hypothetical protein